MADTKIWSRIWEVAEWVSHIDSIMGRMGLRGGESTAQEHKAEATGKAGMFGYKDERALLNFLTELSAEERKVLDGFHRWHFSGSEDFDRLRADVVFNKYRTVLAGMSTLYRETGTKNTTETIYGTKAGDDDKAPFNKVETKTDEKIFSTSKSGAVEFLSQLATAINSRRLATEKSIKSGTMTVPDGTDTDDYARFLGYQAGIEMLEARGMPRMPRDNEKDWIWFLQNAIESAPKVLRSASGVAESVDRKINSINRTTVRKQSKRKGFTGLLMRFLP